MNRYQIIIIGAGPGGYPCAIRLGQLKKKVLVVESKLLGGLCLNWGCIPTKALSFAAEFVDYVEKAKRMGFDVTLNGCDLSKLRSWKENVVKRLRTGIEFLFKSNGVEWKIGTARIVDEHTVEIEDGGAREIFQTDSIVIATGTEVVSLPGLEVDHKHVIDTDDALEISEIPAKLLVIGAGASGLEMATIYSRLGSKVAVVEIMDQILPGMESELCANLLKILKRSGIEVHISSQVAGYEKKDNVLVVSIKTGNEVIKDSFDKILVSVGRKPSDKAFKEMGLDLDKKGYVKVDEWMRTSVKNIYAIGDITGPPLLAHKATKQGISVAEHIAGQTKESEENTIPSCVFTIPPLSSVGLTETEAIASGRKVAVGRFPYRASGKAVSMGETEGMVKIIGDENGALLGIHILGAESPNLIGEAVVALDRGMNVADIAESVHPHPTLTEMIQEAAENFLKKAIHVANK
ncbi:MAG: dihydrolipoyl dehydrogenase [candidate division WOR-3 bacterium]|nr:MAG: dihydrolipoyl dehydrogenase [candidate division WOR-3 bacterium]